MACLKDIQIKWKRPSSVTLRRFLWPGGCALQGILLRIWMWRVAILHPERYQKKNIPPLHFLKRPCDWLRVRGDYALQEEAMRRAFGCGVIDCAYLVKILNNVLQLAIAFVPGECALREVVARANDESWTISLACTFQENSFTAHLLLRTISSAR